MTRKFDSTSLVEEWLSDGPDVAPDRVLAEVASKLGRTRQEGTFLMSRFGRIGALTTAAALAAGVLAVAYFLSRDGGSVGPPTSPSPSSSPIFGEADVLGYIYGSELWVAAEDGSGARAIVDNVDPLGVAWSPDGQQLAFFRDGGLAVLGADGVVRTLTADSDAVGESVAFGGSPSWSPDGTQIVGNGADGLVIVNVSDGATQAVPKAIECMGDPDWGPDGLIVFTGAADCSQGGEPSALHTIRPDGSGVTELFGFGSELGSAAWSPDGDSIAFQADEDGGCLYVIDADGRNVRKLTSGCSQGFSITWSADSARIAWAGGPHGSAEAFVIDAGRGGDPQPITEIGNVTYIDWRPTD